MIFIYFKGAKKNISRKKKVVFHANLSNVAYFIKTDLTKHKLLNFISVKIKVEVRRHIDYILSSLEN